MEAGVILKDSNSEMTIHGESLAREFISKYCAHLSGPAILAATAAVPRIGEYREGQGGIYAGAVRGADGDPDHYLILHKDEKDSIQWQPAIDWAKTLEADGHDDFELPSRREQAILYGNLKDQFKPEWHWSCETHASDPSSAWITYFTGGNQGITRKVNDFRARAVRRVVIQ